MVQLLIMLIWMVLLRPSYQHARLMEPPSRASMWRVGFPTPKDIDDNQSYCGGYGVQHGSNGGRCGICGDPWHEHPRAHEAPEGLYATGIITKTYKQGSYIPVVIDITANHQGYFIFKLCPNNDIFSDPEQACFEQTPLWVGGGEPAFGHTRYPIHDYKTGLRMVYVRLPMYVTCEQCILQWSYVAGNNWGNCENGTSGMGCGPQEMFRSCADIKIIRHPLLSSLMDGQHASKYEEEEDFYDEALLENDVRRPPSFQIEQVDQHRDLASIRKKEALLRKKKKLLEQVIKKLRQLIIQSQVTEDDDQMSSPQRTVSQIKLSPEAAGSQSQNWQLSKDGNGQQVIPWWDRILSNRH